MSGFALCQQIRQTHMFPIIMLTAKGEDLDKITGLTPRGRRLYDQAL